MTADADSESPLGVTIPDEHVGAFVAEVFEDAERDTSWATVVDALVAPAARSAWEELSAQEQAIEVLEAAADFDQRAIDRLDDVPLTSDADVDDAVAEARRLRANADAFRDGVAAAYNEGRLDDDDLVAAIEAVAFDTDAIARREELLEAVAEVHDVAFRPYGGTLLQESDRETADPTAAETW